MGRFDTRGIEESVGWPSVRRQGLFAGGVLVAAALTLAQAADAQSLPRLDAGGDGSLVAPLATVTGGGLVRFTQSSVTVSEGAGSVTLTVTKPAVTSGVSGNQTVDFTLSPASAIAGADYVDISGTLTWVGGESGERTITVNLLNDLAVEGSESFQVVLGSAVGLDLATPSTATVTVVDDDPEAGVTAAAVAGARQDVSDGTPPAPLTVQVTGPGGAPVPGLAITWSLTPASAGTLSAATTNTDANGTASNTLSVGGVGNGLLLVEAVPQGLGQTVQFQINTGAADRPVAAVGEPVAAPSELDQAGVESPPFIVRLDDGLGGPVAGAPVNWSVEPTGAAVVTSPTTTTDGTGRASTTVTPVLTTAFTVVADIGGGSRLRFPVNATALAEEPGLNDTQRGVAEALDNACEALAASEEPILLPAAESPTADETALLALCDGLAELPPDQLADALTDLAAQQVAAMGTAAVEAVLVQAGNLGARLQALRAGSTGFSAEGVNLSGAWGTLPGKLLAGLAQDLRGGGASADEAGFSRWGAFVSGTLSFGEQDTTNRELGFDFDTRGLTAGLDYRFTDSLVAGAALGYVTKDADFSGGAGRTEVDGFSTSLFGTWYAPRQFYVDGILTLGWNGYDTRRELVLPGVGAASAEADPDGFEVSLGVNAGYDYSRGPLTLTPQLRLNYTHATVDDYTETGVGGINLAFDEQDIDSFTTHLGGQGSYAVNTRFGVLLPQLRLEWAHEFADDSRDIGARFVNDPTGTAFRVPTDAPDRDYFNLGTGLTAVFPGGRIAFLQYDTMLGRNEFTQHTVNLGVRLEF